MTVCERAKRDFVRAEILAHWTLETQGRGSAYEEAERASGRAYKRGRLCRWARPGRPRRK